MDGGRYSNVGGIHSHNDRVGPQGQVHCVKVPGKESIDVDQTIDIPQLPYSLGSLPGWPVKAWFRRASAFLCTPTPPSTYTTCP